MMTKRYSGALSFLNEDIFFGEEKPKAAWLLSDFDDPVWYLSRGKITRVEEGRIKGAYTVLWDRMLPDGNRLTSPCYQKLLKIAKYTIFFIRNAPTTQNMDSSHHYSQANSLFLLIDWVVYFKDRFVPASHGLSLLGKDAMEEICHTFALGGSAGTMNIIHRIENYFQSLLQNKGEMGKVEKIIDSSHAWITKNNKDKIEKTFSDSELIKLKCWLKMNNCYHNNGTLKNNRLAELIYSEPFCNIKRISFYKRQFEFVEDYSRMEFSETSPKEYLSVNHVTIEEGQNQSISITTFKKFMCLFKNMAKISSFVEGLPDTKEIEAINSSQIAKQTEMLPENHTPTIPVHITMLCMNEAIRWVINYGEYLVDYFLRVRRKMIAIAGQHKSYKVSQIRELAYKETAQPDSLKPLNITRCKSWLNDKDIYIYNEVGGTGKVALLRKNLSLEDAIRLFVGTIYILIAALSARRASEILYLDRDCLYKKNDGYQLRFEIGKANHSEMRVFIKRPIPNVVAKGIMQLKRLTNELKEINKEKNGFARKLLFYIPSNMTTCSYNGSYESINTILGVFCDYIEVPLNEHGRRWYIKSHEMRRFFAIVFFWQYKYSHLTALQWMMGHVDPDHTYSYIREAIGGKELTKEEARYTANAISEGEPDETLNKVKKIVQKHFNVSDVSLLEKDDLEIYLEELLTQNVFEVSPQSIETEDGCRYDIVFHLKPEAANYA